MIRRRARTLSFLLAFAACSHGDRFAVPDHGTTTPPDAGNPARLTLNPAPDDEPVWLPDGSGILYATFDLARDDGDGCLAILPPTGGRITRLLCDNGQAQWDSTNRFSAPAVAADGRLAFVRFAAGLGLVNPRTIDVMVGPPSGLGAAFKVAALPSTLPGSATHLNASQIRWLGARALVYRGDWRGDVCIVPMPDCATVLITTGINLVYHPLDAALGQRRVLPGTDYVSSVARGDDDDVLYLTYGGDSRVYRYVISTGASLVVHDFGAIARDVHVVGNRLVAVVGGSVTFENRVPAGWVQIDFGGDLVMLDLASGVVTPLGGGSYRHPALSPDGSRIAVSGAGDLWLFEVP